MYFLHDSVPHLYHLTIVPQGPLIKPMMIPPHHQFCILIITWLFRLRFLKPSKDSTALQLNFMEATVYSNHLYLYNTHYETIAYTSLYRRLVVQYTHHVGLILYGRHYKNSHFCAFLEHRLTQSIIVCKISDIMIRYYTI